MELEDLADLDIRPAGLFHLDAPVRTGHPDAENPLDVALQDGPEGFQVPIQGGLRPQEGSIEVPVLPLGYPVELFRKDLAKPLLESPGKPPEVPLPGDHVPLQGRGELLSQRLLETGSGTGRC